MTTRRGVIAIVVGWALLAVVIQSCKMRDRAECERAGGRWYDSPPSMVGCHIWLPQGDE